MPPRRQRPQTPAEIEAEKTRKRERDRARRIVRNQKKRLDKERFVTMDFYGKRIIRGCTVLNAGKAGLGYDKRRMREVAKWYAERQAAAQTNDGLDYNHNDLDAGQADWLDEDDENDFGGQVKDGLLGSMKKVVDEVVQQRETKRYTRQYAQEQIRNADTIKRIIPMLGRALADGSMPWCSCTANRIYLVKVICIDILTCKIKEFQRCNCEHWTARLIIAGFFPTKANTKIAISLDLLDLFLAISSNGSFSKMGFALGLREFHRKKLRSEPLRRYDEFFRACVPFYLRVRRARDEFLNRVLNFFFQKQAKERTDAKGTGAEGTDAEGTGAEGTGAEGTGAEGTTGNQTQTQQEPPIVQFGTLVSQCPACFYRTPDDKSPVIIGLDGNMQHSRYSHVGKTNVENYGEQLFFPVPFEDRERVDISLPNVAGTICEHNFKATTKPNTMTFKDETGLLMIVCRHDMPLRFLNIYAGERLGWVVYTLKNFIELLEREVGKLDVILLYDIACQLSSYIRKRHPELYERLTVAVNKFHGYAHEYRCQELFGQHQTKHIGQSDGEGTERVWALLRSLVVAGRISTAANRVLFLETLSFAIMNRKRMHLGSALWHRFRRQTTQLKHYEVELIKLLGSEVEDGQGSRALLTEELLRAEQTKQRQYFTTTSPLISQPNTAIYEALKTETECLTRVNEVHAKYAGRNLDANMREVYGWELKGAGIEALPSYIDAVDAALRKANQSREEWNMDGERYTLAARLSNQEQKVYNALVIEKKAEEALKKKKEGTTPLPDVVVEAYESVVKKAKAKTEVELQALGSCRDLWSEDGELWDKQFRYAKLTELQLIYNRLLRSAASRTLELRRVKAHTFGGKPAAKLLDGIHKKHASMSRDIKSFNDIITQLPDYAPHKLTLSAFNGNDDLTPGSEKARDALFHLHVLKSDLLGTLQGPKSYWTCSEKVRVGISHQLRRDRCLEELEMLQHEWKRHLSYTYCVLEGLLEFVMTTPQTKDVPNFVKTTYRFLWDELEAGENLVNAAAFAKKKFGKEVFSVGNLELLVKRIKFKIDKNYHSKPNQLQQPQSFDAGQLQQPQPPNTTDNRSDQTSTQDNADDLNENDKGFGDIKEEVYPEDEIEDIAEIEELDADSSDDESNDKAKSTFSSVLSTVDEIAEREGMLESALEVDEIYDIFS